MSQSSTGARVVFKVGNTKVAFANALNYTVSHGHQPVDVLDQLEPAEYAEVSYTVNFTATLFRISTEDSVTLGLRPKLQDILTQPELTVTLEDSVTGVSLMNINRVKCTQEDFNVDARSLGQTTLSFVGIKMFSGPSGV